MNGAKRVGSGVIGRLAIGIGLAALLAPVAGRGAGGIVFSPTALPAGKAGTRYQAVITVAVDGHHPTLGKDYPSYTIACYGADGASSPFSPAAPHGR